MRLRILSIPLLASATLSLAACQSGLPDPPGYSCANFSKLRDGNLSSPAIVGGFTALTLDGSPLTIASRQVGSSAYRGVKFGFPAVVVVASLEGGAVKGYQRAYVDFAYNKGGDIPEVIAVWSPRGGNPIGTYPLDQGAKSPIAVAAPAGTSIGILGFVGTGSLDGLACFSGETVGATGDATSALSSIKASSSALMRAR